MRARAHAGDPGGRPRRRRWWMGLLSGLAVLAGAYFYFQYEIVDPLLKPLIETQLAQAVHSPVVIGSVRAGLTGNVVLNHVLLTVPGNPWESHIQVGQVSVEVQLYDLLFHKKPIEDCLESLSFIRPQITLVKNANATPAPTAGLPSLPAPSASSGVTVPIPIFPVPKVSIRQGSFLVQPDKTPREVLTDLRFDASTVNGTAWGLSISAHSPETGGMGVVRFNGGFQPDGIKLRGVMSLNRWPLASAGSILKETTGWDLTAGTINAESPVVFQLGKDLWYDAKADVDQATLKTPGPVIIAFSNIAGRAFIRPREINLPGQITFQTGQTRWQASGFVPLDGRPLSVRSSTDKLYLATVLGDILKLNQLQSEGTGAARLVVSGPLMDPVVTGSAELGPSKVGRWPLDSLAIKGHFENQVLTFDSAKGQLLGGSFAGNGFSSILDRPDAPLSLMVKLTDVDAKQVASVLGISQTEGKINQEVRLGGNRSNFYASLSSTGQMDLTRRLRGEEIHYVIRNKTEYKNQKLTVSATLNDKSKLEAVFAEEAADWKLEKFSAVSAKKAVRLTGHGVIPKAPDQPLQIEVTGRDLTLEDLPIFNDQFPDISGKVSLDLKVGGTQKELSASTRLSGEARLGDREPSPLELSLSWKEGQGTLDIEKLEVGPQFSVSGQLALDPDKPNDLKIAAEDIPLPTIAEIADWNNPPEPLEGSVTGHLHLSGLKKNPIVEGDDIVLKDVKAGDWSADKITASVDMSEGKLLLKKMRFDQGEKFLEVNGSWDTNPQSGLLALRFSSKGFQLGKGPYLTGDLVLDAKSTGDPFWENWTGTLSSKTFTLTDLNKRDYHFNDFSMPTSCDDLVLKSRFKEGPAIAGSTVLDLKSSVPTLQALLKIGPASLAEMPELTQFLPSGLKVTGNISGEIKLKKGPLGELPMEGSLTVMNGSIQKYDFDKMELAFEGNKSKISPQFTLVRDQAQYSLSGTLSSAKSFWDPESSIDVTGPVKREKLENIVTLLGFNTETHRVAGEVSGDLTLTGTFSNPVFGFSVRGDELLYDNINVSSADLQFSYSDGKVTLGNNQITLPKGQIKIDQGSASLDPKDSGVAVLDLDGSTQDLPIGPFNFTSQIHLSGNLALEDKEDRPTFDGLVSVWETVQEPRSNKSFFGGLFGFLEAPPKTIKTTPFDVALRVHHKVIEFNPLDNDHPQILGKVDLSQAQKILFDHLRLANASGSFLVDGNLDFNGPCSLVSDSKNVPIQEIGKWLWPGFPLSGTGSYHLVFEGSLDDPLFTISLSVMDGRVGDLPFDLLDGELKSSNNTLFFGDEENPITLSRKGAFSFTLGGKMPLALTPAGWLKIRDREMDVTAQMEKGDFSLVMMTGWPQKASGDMDFSAHIGGTLDNPDLNLDLDLAKCQLVPPMVAQSIDDLNGRIKVRHNKLAVEDLNGRIGQGRVFITSPPVDESKMILVDFIPQYLDFRVQTIGNHGVWLSIPTIMRKGEWGEIYFYGQTPNDPLVIQGPLSSPVVSGTALLDTGHFTFPPIEALDDSGKKIEYRELAGVKFDLKLVSGKNTWYSNDFNSNYLELRVDPGESIKIEGRDSDSTPEQRGIQCYGTASSSEGWLLYLSHKFNMENGWITISRGKAPYMWGRATDTLTNIDVISAGGVVKSDVNIWVDFKGTFGNVDFTLGSSPLFDPTDTEKQQKLLLSYIMFGRDMTGYTTQQLQQYYQQNYGQAATGAIVDTFNRIALNEATRGVRSYVQQLLGADVQLNGNPIPGGSADASGNSLSAVALQAEITKPINQKLSLKTDLGFNRGVTGDLSPEGSVGMEYLFNNKLKGTAEVGQNVFGQTEARVELGFHTELPDAIAPKKGDTVKPHFERFDVFPVGPGKFSLKWVTDKVTKCEIRVLDTDGQIVRDITEKKNFDYYHDMILDGLAPNQDFQIQITAKDPNGNERLEAQKASASFD